MRPGGPGAPSGAEMVGLGVFLATVVIVPMLVGGVLDVALKTGPAFLLLGLLVGVAGGVGGAYMRFRRFF